MLESTRFLPESQVFGDHPADLGDPPQWSTSLQVMGKSSLLPESQIQFSSTELAKPGGKQCSTLPAEMGTTLPPHPLTYRASLPGFTEIQGAAVTTSPISFLVQPRHLPLLIRNSQKETRIQGECIRTREQRGLAAPRGATELARAAAVPARAPSLRTRAR